MSGEVDPQAAQDDADEESPTKAAEAPPALDRGLRVRKLLLLGPGAPFIVDFTHKTGQDRGATGDGDALGLGNADAAGHAGRTDAGGMPVATCGP